MNKEIQSLFAEKGILKAAELKAAGVSYKSITELLEAKEICRAKNGYYMLPGTDPSEEELILKFFPDGVFTMATALYFYGYLEHRPLAWNIAVSKNSSKSRFRQDYPILTPYYTEPEVLQMGVREMAFAGGRMKIYTKDRLICDVLKYEERLERPDLRRAAFAYIEDEEKDVAKLLEYARERRVLKKVQGMIGVWL